jgi:putative ATP-binding cassette transporter
LKKFIAFIRRESPEFSGTLVALALFSGLVNGLSVSLAIQTAKKLRPGELHMREFFLFAICLLAFWITKEYVLNRTNRILEGIIRNLRVRIIDGIKTTNLAVFERIDRGRVVNTLSTDSIALSYAAGSIINASSSAFMLVFVLVSIGILSMSALAITLIMVSTAVYLYMQKSHTLTRELGEATRLENAFFHNVDGVMSGYKQLKLNRRKSDDFFSTEIWNVINETAALRIKTGKTMNQSALLSQTFMLFTIAGILFLLPNLRPGDVPVVAPVLAILLFATGPISDVVMAIPALARAEASITNIESLENDLRHQRSELEAMVERQPIQTEPFESIACVGTGFAYAPTPGNGPHGF